MICPIKSQLCTIGFASSFWKYNYILFAYSQNESSLKTLFRLLLVLEILLGIFNWHVSSAKWNGWENFFALCNSLMYIKNKREPKTDHWVSPYSILCASELKPFMTNHFLRGKKPLAKSYIP